MRKNVLRRLKKRDRNVKKKKNLMAGIKQEEKFFFCPCNFPFISLWYLYYLQFQIKSKKLFSLYFNPLFRENKEKVA
jgi:hypothetical protein